MLSSRLPYDRVSSKWRRHEQRNNTTVTDRMLTSSTGLVRGQLATIWTEPHLSDRRDGGRSGDFGVGGDLTTSGSGDGVLLRAVSRDMTGFTALVAGLTSCIQRTTVRGGAIA